MDTSNRFTIVRKSEPDIVDAVRAAVKKKSNRRNRRRCLEAIGDELKRLDRSIDRVFAVHGLLTLAIADEYGEIRADYVAAARDFLYREAEQELNGIKLAIRDLLEKERGA